MGDRYHQVMHEKSQDTLDAILEYVRDIPEIKQRVTALENLSDSAELKLDVVSRIVKEHSPEIREMKKRFGSLDVTVQDNTRKVTALTAAINDNSASIREIKIQLAA